MGLMGGETGRSIRFYSLGRVAIEARTRLRPETLSVRVARRFVVDTLRSWGSAGHVDVAELLTSELVTNAVLHVGSEVGLVVRLTPLAVRVEVLDASPEPPLPRHYEYDDLNGRGLRLVESMSAAWGFDPNDHGKVVWFELPRSA
jgi:anti-sigma regulatory factor (Ser/Thr protein kinase)